MRRTFDPVCKWHVVFRCLISAAVTSCARQVYKLNCMNAKHEDTSITHIAYLRRVSQLKIYDFFQEKLLKVLKCCNFLWVQRQHKCCPVASFEDCIMTLYLLKAHLQTFLSILVTQKCQILSYDTLVANERYIVTILSL